MEAEKNNNSILVRLDGLFGWDINSGAYMGKVAVYTSQGKALIELAREGANLNLESPTAKFISCRPIITDVAGDTAFLYVRSWISQCLSIHEHCKK